ncbi:MAG: septum site-determining protein MinC [Nitrosomonas sp.]|nr:septum site-determining protein MinC [Nitrosomonas sp.]MCC7135630.1 septum site-determining protein MinC [Nitrosomonas sp.]
MDGSQSLVLELKSSTFFAPVLVLYSNEIDLITEKLKEKISGVPDFFNNSAILFDLTELNHKRLSVDIDALVSILREMHIFPIGIRGGNDAQQQQALALSIPVDSGRSSGSMLLETQSKPDIPYQPQASVEIIKEVFRAPATLVIQPVRSGQRIYANGDLVILAQVSAGAEIMAEGNIHVYNTLRGRALAGVQGDTAARLFCLDLQAELVSIAGVYKTSEDLKDIVSKKPVQVFLQEQALIIAQLD